MDNSLPDSVLEELRDALAAPSPALQSIINAGPEVQERFRKVFAPENLERLNKEDFLAFLSFKSNRHWTSLSRLGPGITTDMPQLRRALAVLLDESVGIQARLDRLAAGEREAVPRMGRGVMTAILMVVHPRKYSVWNNQSIEAMQALGIYPELDKHASLGEQYLMVNAIAKHIADELGTDLWVLDGLWREVDDGANGEAADDGSEADETAQAESNEGADRRGESDLQTTPTSRKRQFVEELLKLLASNEQPLLRDQIHDSLRASVQLSEAELALDHYGRARWWLILNFHCIALVKAGFLTRRRGVWTLTQAGRNAVSTLGPANAVLTAEDMYASWAAERPEEEPAGDEEDTDGIPTGDSRRIWMFSVRDEGQDWPMFRDSKCVAINLRYEGGRLGDLSQLTKDQIREQMVRITGIPNPFNRQRCAWEFAHVMREGDVVIARSGRYRLHGMGVVRGPYRFEPSNPDLRHQRDVDWIATHERVQPSGYGNATKTLTDVTGYPDYVETILGRDTPATRSRLLANNVPKSAIDAYFLQKPYSLPATTATAQPRAIAEGAPTFEQIDEESFLNLMELKEIASALNTKKAIVLQGSPGTGKSYLAEKLAHMHAGSRSRVMKVQFHPSYGYEDFVRGIRPRENGGFGVENGTLVQMALRAQAEPMQQFVLLLDEINRANVAKVMGEALSLIEGDKREAKHAVQLGLAHDGKREFHLPPNLYIIATMNTADRSIALVDYALRRRFAFFTLQPAFDRDEFRQWLLEALGADDSEHDADARSTQAEARKVTDRIVETMRSVNDRIRGHKALGPNYVLGHSFFCTYQAALGESATAWVERVFKTEIAPLLEEYAVEHPRLKQELLDLIQG